MYTIVLHLGQPKLQDNIEQIIFPLPRTSISQYSDNFHIYPPWLVITSVDSITPIQGLLQET